MNISGAMEIREQITKKIFIFYKKKNLWIYDDFRGTRLLLSGEESENKQKLREFIINSAKCNENFTQEDIYQIRVSNLSNLVNSKIGPLLNGYQNLQAQNTEQCLTNFSELCEQILVNTCSVLSDSQCLFNEKTIESLNGKIKSILTNCILYNKIENDLNKCPKDIHTSDNLLTHTKYGLQKTCSVSLEKLDENIINQYIIKKVNINLQIPLMSKISKCTYWVIFSFIIDFLFSYYKWYSY